MFKRATRIFKKLFGLSSRQNLSYIEQARAMGVNVGENVDLVTMPHFSSEPYLITIGNDTTISFEVAFITHDAATRVILHLPDGNPKTVIYSRIEVGKNCFIGARSTILPNVRIGDNTIIGACSLVNRDIPSGVVAAGNPCKVICTLEEYRKKHDKEFFYMVSLPYKQKQEYLLRRFDTI